MVATPAEIKEEPIAFNSQAGLFDALPSPVIDALKKINPDNLTPRQALDHLYRLKEIYAKNKEN